MTCIRTSRDPVRTWQTRHCNTHRVVRTLSDVLSDIERVGPVVWTHDQAVWNALSHEARSEALDRLDDLQAEARSLIEAKLGVTWDQIQGANL